MRGRQRDVRERAAGILGIIGGLVLLAALLPGADISPGLNSVRLALYFAGAIAVALAVHGRQASPAPRLWLAVAMAVVIANAATLALIVVGTVRPQPPEPDPGYRFVLFLASTAFWWADVAFGIVVWRLGEALRWGGLALAAGSVLAFLGIDRLELASGDLGWFFQPVALAGIAVNGLGWILLGLDLVLDRRRRATSEPQPVPMR